MNLEESIWIAIAILFFGSIIYMLFRGPASTLVFSSESDAELQRMRDCLIINGINAYIKNKAQYRMRHYGGLHNPSLHVVNPEDRKRALQIIRDAKNK